VKPVMEAHMPLGKINEFTEKKTDGKPQPITREARGGELFYEKLGDERKRTLKMRQLYQPMA